MSELMARTGRHQQRYENGYRLIAGCVPFRYRNVKEDVGGTSEKGGWENDESHETEEAAIRDAMEEAGV